MNSFIDSHYVPLPSQSNIYLSTVINRTDGTNILLIATLRRKVMSFEYQLTDTSIKPVVRDIQFSYIPTGSEIISIDAFNKSLVGDDFVIGITTIKNSEGSSECYFNLYSDTTYEVGNDFSVSNISQNCENLELEYIPYGLYHVQLPPHLVDSKHEIVCLLCGSDKQIHIYRELDSHSHYEVCHEDIFPEFSDISDIVYSLDIRYYNQFFRRITCYGCESGEFRCVIIDTITQQILINLSHLFNNLIADISLFTILTPRINRTEFLNIKCDLDWQNTDIDPEINILVAVPLYHSVVFMNVLKNNLQILKTLEDSNEYDVVTCCTNGDIDFDGRKEILLGSYGQELLIYKYRDEDKKWEIMDHASFPNPIHKIWYADFTGDGVNELLVQTMKGVHIYQHDWRIVSKVINTRLNKSINDNADTENGSVTTLAPRA